MADSFIQLPPDSSGKQLNTSLDTVNAESVHTQRFVIAGGDPGEIENYAAVDRLGALSTTFAEGTPALDAFGRILTDSPKPQLLEHFVDDAGPETFTFTNVGGGANLRVTQTSSIRMSVGTASGDIARMESNKIIRYTPGVGMHCAFTAWSGDAGKANVVRRAGMFNDENGVFFELDGTTMNFVVRSNTTGSVVETKYPQAGWTDPLDGSGNSSVVANFTNLNILWFDYQWLGGGAIRFGIYDPKGNRIVAGTVENANSVPRPYMKTGSNRFRAEIENTGASGSTSEINLVCIGIFTDGAGASGRTIFGDLGVSGVGVSGADVYIASARPKATYKGVDNVAVAVPAAMEFYSDQPVKLDFVFGATSITGGTFAEASDGPLEWDTAGSAITGGRVVRSSVIGAGRTELDLRDFYEVSLSTLNLWPGGVSVPFCLIAHQLGASAATEFSCTLRYEELK